MDGDIDQVVAGQLAAPQIVVEGKGQGDQAPARLQQLVQGQGGAAGGGILDHGPGVIEIPGHLQGMAVEQNPQQQQRRQPRQPSVAVN